MIDQFSAFFLSPLYIVSCPFEYNPECSYRVIIVNEHWGAIKLCSALALLKIHTNDTTERKKDEEKGCVLQALSLITT